MRCNRRRGVGGDPLTTTNIRTRSQRRPLEEESVPSEISSNQFVEESLHKRARTTTNTVTTTTSTTTNGTSNTNGTISTNRSISSGSGGMVRKLPTSLSIHIPKLYEHSMYQGFPTSYAMHDLLLHKGFAKQQMGAVQDVFASQNPLDNYLWKYDFTNPDIGSRCAYFHQLLEQSRSGRSSRGSGANTPTSKGVTMQVSPSLVQPWFGIDYAFANSFSHAQRTLEQNFQYSLRASMFRSHQKLAYALSSTQHKSSSSSALLTSMSVVTSLEHADYFVSKIQSQFTYSDRAKLIDSLLHLTKRFHFASPVIFTAVSILDYYFMKTPLIAKSDLLEVGIACLLIAYKWDRCAAIKFPMQSILRACFIESEEEREELRERICKRELHVFSKIGMNIQAIPTLWNFLTEYMKVLQPSAETESAAMEEDFVVDESFYLDWMKLTLCICERILLEYAIMKTFLPSKIVCAAFSMSFAMLRRNRQQQQQLIEAQNFLASPSATSSMSYEGIPRVLQQHCGYRNQDIETCIHEIQHIFREESYDYLCYFMKKWWEKFGLCQQVDVNSSTRRRNGEKSFSYEVFLQFVYQFLHADEYVSTEGKNREDHFQQWQRYQQDLRHEMYEEGITITDETWRLVCSLDESLQQRLQAYLSQLPQLVEEMVHLPKPVEDNPRRLSTSSMMSTSSLESSLLSAGDWSIAPFEACYIDMSTSDSFLDLDISRTSTGGGSSSSRRSSMDSTHSSWSYRTIDEHQSKLEHTRWQSLCQRINERMNGLLSNDPYDEYEPLRSVRIRYHSIYHQFLVTCPPML